jgi:peptidyl-prolyl cis-trans isomerase C
MSGAAPAISVNGVVIDVARDTPPELAAVRELLRQRAIAIGLLRHESPDDGVDAAIEQLLEAEVPTPSPTDAECRRYYAAHHDAFRSGDLVFVRHILFQITPGGRVDLIRGEAEQTLAQVMAAPEEFAACALTLSNCPSGRHGGNLGQIGRGDTVPEFEDALFAETARGILPRLVKTRHGFHIVAIDRRVEGRVLPFEMVRDRIADRLAARVQEVALRQYVRLLAGQADIQGVDLDATPTPLLQ